MELKEDVSVRRNNKVEEGALLPKCAQSLKSLGMHKRQQAIAGNAMSHTVHIVCPESALSATLIVRTVAAHAITRPSSKKMPPIYASGLPPTI